MDELRPTGLVDFSQVEELFASKEVTQIFVKHLSQRQDNDKNQIYLGSRSEGVLNIFPSEVSLRSESESTKKPRSSRGQQKIEAKLEFHWLDRQGNSFSAPETRIIDYFQYPEVRLSGFLSGCDSPPDSLRRRHQEDYGRRILILGPSSTGTTYGLVLTAAQDPLVQRFPQLNQSEVCGVLRTHVIGASVGSDPRASLMDELRSLVGVWHPSVSLRSAAEGPQPFNGNQGAGWTLEALLGIPRNASKTPDKHGFEIKSFKQGGKISLMTPTADVGEEGSLAFRDFMARYGWPARRGDGTIVFNGTHKYNKRCLSSGYVLDVHGYDPSKRAFASSSEQITPCLMDREKDLMVSGWSFQKLLSNWSKKHAQACYVEYVKRPYSGTDPRHDSEYMYTGNVYIGSGTNIFLYLHAIVSRCVYYDSGHEITSTGKAKQRPQWRISVSREFEKTLSELYYQVEKFTLN